MGKICEINAQFYDIFYIFELFSHFLPKIRSHYRYMYPKWARYPKWAK